MKVWIVNHYAIPPAYGGLNRHYYFSKKLKEKKVTTQILTSSKIHNSDKNFICNNSLYSKQEIDGIDYTFVKTGDYKGNGLRRIFSFVQFPFNVYRTMKKLSEKELPDIIYASSPELFATWVAIKFAKKKNLPIIVEIRDLWPESVVAYSNLTERNPIIKILYRLEKSIYKQADLLVFTFEGGENYIKDKKWDKENGGPIELNKIHYINNGVDINEFHYNAENFNIKDKELDSSSFKVVYTGSVRRVNAVYLIVEAAEYLKEKGINDVSFIIYGDGTEKNELSERCYNLGLKNVFFRNRIDKKYIPSILKRADAVIFVGEKDNMNKYGLSLNKLFDYMAAGKPIISNIETKYDNILRYDCGIVAANGKGNEIGEAILDIKNMNDKKYNKLCENALSAAENFDFVRLTDKLYEILLKESKRGE